MSPNLNLKPVLAIFGPGGKSGKHPHVHSRAVAIGGVGTRLGWRHGDLQDDEALQTPFGPQAVNC